MVPFRRARPGGWRERGTRLSGARCPWCTRDLPRRVASSASSPSRRPRPRPCTSPRRWTASGARRPADSP